jgi:hypothetical protein
MVQDALMKKILDKAKLLSIGGLKLKWVQGKSNECTILVDALAVQALRLEPQDICVFSSMEPQYILEARDRNPNFSPILQSEAKENTH